jgi:tRNA(Ile)-lysidine synthase
VATLTQRLLNTIRKQGLIKPGDRVGVAVSGGSDSVGLLLLLLDLRADLGIVLSVVHVNHKLRGSESDEDEGSIAQLARAHGLELHVCAAPLIKAESGVEAAARGLRYNFFRQLAAGHHVIKIATAHTLDDQAETVLMRMLRGTGIRGLAGIHPRLPLKDGGEVVRPLLTFRHAEVEAFLRERGQSWRTDSSNRELTFLRNRVRHRLMLLLEEEFGMAASHNLADLAEIARAEEEHWETGHPEVRVGEKIRGLAVDSLSPLPLAAQRRLIGDWLEMNSVTPSFRWIEQLRDLASGPAGKVMELPGGKRARRTQRELCIEPAENEARDYAYRLPVPGQVDVPELAIRVEASLVEPESVPITVPIEDSQSLLDPALVPAELVLRNWRPGDRYWPAHTREEKKIKELLNDRHIVGSAKHLWPVVGAENGELVWMKDFAAPSKFAARQNSRALWIRVIDPSKPR